MLFIDLLALTYIIWDTTDNTMSCDGRNGTLSCRLRLRVRQHLRVSTIIIRKGALHFFQFNICNYNLKESMGKQWQKQGFERICYLLHERRNCRGTLTEHQLTDLFHWMFIATERWLALQMSRAHDQAWLHLLLSLIRTSIDILTKFW